MTVVRAGRCSSDCSMRRVRVAFSSGNRATNALHQATPRGASSGSASECYAQRMSQPVDDPRRALYEAYLEVPEHKCAEILDGTLYVLPRPSPPHANAASVLGGDLNGAFQRGRGGPGGWWILHEPELHLVELEPMSPDIAGWRVERMRALPETAHFTVVPDWVCEILSKSTENIDRNKKLPIYATCGMKHAWLVDPIAKTLEVHILGEGGRWREVRLHREGEVVRAPPFEAIEIELDALWSPPHR